MNPLIIHIDDEFDIEFDARPQDNLPITIGEPMRLGWHRNRKPYTTENYCDGTVHVSITLMNDQRRRDWKTWLASLCRNLSSKNRREQRRHGSWYLVRCEQCGWERRFTGLLETVEQLNTALNVQPQ